MIVPVVHSLTGQVLQIELADGALVEELRNCLKRQTNIEVDSQVLICEWEPERSLERRKAVAFYGLPKEGNFIFLYDKAWFRSGGPDHAALLSSKMPKVEAQLPSQEQSLAGSSLMAPSTAEVEPMQTALINYAASFAHWKGTAEAYRSAAMTRIDIADKTTEQLQMMMRASVLARSSLHIYHTVVEASLVSLEKELQRANSEVDRVLPSFEETVQKLKETELHPSHCKATRLPENTRLISFVKDEEALRRRVADCRQIRTTLEEQVKEGRRQYEEVSVRVTEELERSAGEEGLVKAADEALIAMRQATKDTIEARLETFTNDFSEIEGCLNKGQQNQSSVSWEFMGELQKRYQTGKDHVTSLVDADKDLGERLVHCMGRKETMTRVVVSRLQKVADLQGQMQQLKKRWDALQEVARQEMSRQFGEVDVIVNLPSTYREWCLEVSRRRSYWTATVSQAEAASSTLQKQLDEEQERRLNFITQWETLMPEQLLRLLCDGGAAAARPPRLEVNVSGRPRLLPDIELEGGVSELPLPLISDSKGGDRGSEGGAGGEKGDSGREGGGDGEEVARLKKEVEEAKLREAESAKREKELKERLEALEKEGQGYKEEREARKEAAAKSVDEKRMYEEELEGLEKELERKNKFLAEASENSARLELNLNYTREQLQIDKAQRDALANGQRRIGQILGIDAKQLSGTTLVSGRPRRISSDRETGAEELMEAITASVQKLVESNAKAAPSSPQISLASFEEGSVALFMPLGGDRVHQDGSPVYMAFNLGCPRHYLDASSLEAFIEADSEKAGSYCLGRITCRLEHTVSEDEVESYGIAAGDIAFICSAEPIAQDE